VSFLGEQGFKLIVTDPDSVLGGLTKEVKEEGPDGQEVGNDCKIS
jgi:translation initiation factor 2 subunit 1